MNRIFAVLLLAVIALSSSLQMMGQKPGTDWVGFWELDYTTPGLGRPLTLKIGPDKEWSFYINDMPEPGIVCDGKPHPRPQGNMQSCVFKNDHEVDFDANTDSPMHVVLSNDGSRLTFSEIYNPTLMNSLESLPEEFARLSPGTGFEGTWISTRYIHSPSSIEFKEPIAGYLLMQSVYDPFQPGSAMIVPESTTPVKQIGEFGRETTLQFTTPDTLTIKIGSDYTATYTRKDDTLEVRETGCPLAIYHRPGPPPDAN
jgi:hypothetical protein